MKLYIYFFIIIIGCINCSQSTKTIEIKNKDGIVTEQYTLNSDSLKVNEAKTFYDEGSLFDLSNYDNGKLNGKRTIFHKDGSIDTEENYIDGVLTGAYKQFHKNGNLMQTGSYTKGVLEGEVVSYFEDGKLREKVTFTDNRESGPFVEYYENGMKHWEGTYRNGDNEFGLLIEYDTLEIMIKKMKCDTLGMCRTIWTKEKGDITPSF